MTRGIGVCAQVYRRTERGEGHAVAVLQVTEDFARRWSVAGPDGQGSGNRRSNVVNQWFISYADLSPVPIRLFDAGR